MPLAVYSPDKSGLIAYLTGKLYHGILNLKLAHSRVLICAWECSMEISSCLPNLLHVSDLRALSILAGLAPSVDPQRKV